MATTTRRAGTSRRPSIRSKPTVSLPTSAQLESAVMVRRLPVPKEAAAFAKLQARAARPAADPKQAYPTWAVKLADSGASLNQLIAAALERAVADPHHETLGEVQTVLNSLARTKKHTRKVSAAVAGPARASVTAAAPRRKGRSQ